MIENAEPFVAEFNRAYGEATELENVCRHRFYGDETEESEDEEDATVAEDDSLDYYQIGRRTSVPVSLVEEGRFRYVSETVADALVEGEKSFVAESLGRATENGNTRRTPDSSSVVSEASRVVEEPNLVLVPRTERYDRVVQEWSDEGRVRKFGGGEYYVGGDENEGDCWLHRYDGSDAEAVFVVDTERVSIVQKKGDATERPTGLAYDSSAESLNDDEPVSVYFGEERYVGNGGYEEYGEFFDLLYRVVVSEPVVGEGGVCKVVLEE